MTSDNNNHALTIFGIGTIVLWLSYVIYIPPFVAWPDAKGIAKEVWESKLGQEMYQSQNDIENRFNRSLYVAYSKVYLMAILGVAAGFLILAKRKTGRYLALLSAILMIGSRIFAAVRCSGGITGWFKVIYGFLLSRTPITVIHKDIIAPLFFVFTIMFLSNRSVITRFKANAYKGVDTHSSLALRPMPCGLTAMLFTLLSGNLQISTRSIFVDL